RGGRLRRRGRHHGGRRAPSPPAVPAPAAAAVTAAAPGDLDGFRTAVRDWCRAHVPADWRAAQTGVSDEAYVAFQQAWFQELRGAGWAVPHWPEAWGGGLSTAEQVMLHQEL